MGGGTVLDPERGAHPARRERTGVKRWVRGRVYLLLSVSVGMTTVREEDRASTVCQYWRIQTSPVAVVAGA